MGSPEVAAAEETEHRSPGGVDTEDTDEDMEMDEEAIVLAAAYDDAASRKRARIKKILLGLVLLGFVIFVIVDSTTNGYIRDGIQTFLSWIEENPVQGFFIFMGVYVVATILFVPGLILTLGSGFVFSNAFGTGLGLVVATLAVFVGAGLGSICAFLISRYVLREWAQGLTQKFPVFRAIDTALEEKGLRIMILLRLSPIIPFNALNYVCGVTAVPFRHYALALFAMLPGTILYVFLGASAQSLANIGSSTDSAVLTIVTVVVGVVLGIVAVALSSRYAKKELNKVRDAEREWHHRGANPYLLSSSADYGSCHAHSLEITPVQILAREEEQAAAAGGNAVTTEPSDAARTQDLETGGEGKQGSESFNDDR